MFEGLYLPCSSIDFQGMGLILKLIGRTFNCSHFVELSLIFTEKSVLYYKMVLILIVFFLPWFSLSKLFICLVSKATEGLKQLAFTLPLKWQVQDWYSFDCLAMKVKYYNIQGHNTWQLIPFSWYFPMPFQAKTVNSTLI